MVYIPGSSFNDYFVIDRLTAACHWTDKISMHRWCLQIVLQCISRHCCKVWLLPSLHRLP